MNTSLFWDTVKERIILLPKGNFIFFIHLSISTTFSRTWINSTISIQVGRVWCLKIVSYKQTLSRGNCQRIDISKRSRRGSSADRAIFKLTIASSRIWLRCRLVTSLLSLRHRDRRSSCRADCRQSSDTIEECDLRAIKTPWSFSGAGWKRSPGWQYRVSLTNRTFLETQILRYVRHRLFHVKDLTESHQFSIFDIEYFASR